MGGLHVVQKDNVDAVDFDKSTRLLQVVCLHFDADVWPFLAKPANLIGEPGKPSEGGKMIVLYEDHVVQARTMIHATASDNRGLFQCAQPRGRFACVEYFGGMIADGVNELPGERCDAAEALKKIQRNAFGFENRTRKPAHFDDDVASNYGFAIRMNDLDIRRRIDLPKNFRGRPGAGNDRWFTRNDASGCVQRFGNEKLGRDVARRRCLL